MESVARKIRLEQRGVNIMAISKDPFPAVPPNAREWIRTEFNLPGEYARLCQQFYLRVWSGSFVARLIDDGKMVDSRADDWIIHWASTPEICKSSEKVACSFREYDGKRYVVIKVWNQKN